MLNKYIRVDVLALYITVIFLASCQSNEAVISGRFIGGDSQVAYLEEFSGPEGVIIDSAVLSKNGEFVFKLMTKDEHHKLYNVVYDWSTIPLFAAAGDDITLNSVGNVAKNYTVEGSEESELMRQFYQSYIGGIATLDNIALRYADESIDDAQREVLAKEYTEEYNKIKRAQLAFIVENSSKLAAVYALYQRLPNDSYLFTGRNDVIYYRTVADALAETYPESPYRKAIMKDIESFDALNSLGDKVSTLEYPELKLNDIFGEPRALSALGGKVILLDFWSAQLGSSNRNNVDLKDLYADIHDKGFEVYQVAIDNSKSTWINAVQEQALPWISVSDLLGNRSRTLSLYNITALPSNYVISRDGEIVARNVYGAELSKIIRQEIAK